MGNVGEEAEGDTLFLITDMDNPTTGGSVNVHDTLLVHQGRFVAEGHIDAPTLCLLYSANGQGVLTPFILEPGQIHFDYSPESGETRVSGTDMNEAMQALNDSVLHYGTQVNDIISAMHGSSPTLADQQAATLQIETLTQHMNQCLYNMAEQNIGNELGYAILTYFDNDSFSSEQRQSLISRLPESIRQRQRIQEMERMLNTPQGATQVPDVRINSQRGTQVSLLEEVSKNPFTVIDFWASWCAPCMREMPKMVRLYHQYHAQGLGMIGISLDMNPSEWEKAIDKFGLPWLQLCDMKGWESDIAEELNIQAIPYTLLVDNTGKVLAAGLDSDELNALLQQLFE